MDRINYVLESKGQFHFVKTEKQIFRFKKQVINAVDDYLKYILSDISKMYKQLQRKTKIK